MPTLPASPMDLSQLPAKAVHQHFATRPALFSVVYRALSERILERYPSLDLNLLSVKLASPDATGHYTFKPLISVAIEHVLNPQLLDLHSHRELPYFLTQKDAKILKPATLPLIDMQVIATIIDEVRLSLSLYFQHDLADYWSAIDSHGNSRWQWLGEFLNGQMTAAAAGQSSLSETQRDMLRVVAAWPVMLERLPHSSPPTYVYFIENTFTRAGKDVQLLTPDLLLVRDKQVLLYSVAGVVEAFTSIDEFGDAWGVKMQRQFQFDSMTCRRNEPDGNVFELQAGLILNQQLEDLATLTFEGHDERTLERRLEKITDPAVFFTKIAMAATPLLQKVSDQLPDWLRQATSADRFAYHRHLQDMARVLRQNEGRSFNEGIENIQQFSRDALRKQMQTDHGDFDPDAVLLDFAVAAGYPGGSGIIEHVQMSLTELALKNLAGKPKGTLTLTSKSTASLPTWLDADYLLGSNGLIQRVDIGTTYPQKIKDLLLSDTADARRREALFTRELKVHLPMQALEHKVRQLNGVTITGYRYVKALMGEMPSDRIVDGQEIVLRPLALCRKIGAKPDEVNNAFIIEPRDASVGPHLLYLPLYADALHEYPTRQALLDALAEPGDLQSNVLTWLTDKARPIYDNGGFKEPHIIRFLPGDEFSRPETPVPATLAVDEGAGEWLQSQINGQLLNHLFGSTARALVDLADRESVSNSESRWAIMMEGAWLLFNTLLLPLVQGPAMLAGWFLVLVSSLEQDLAGLDSDDPTTRELALIDLLLNTAMVLLHAATPSTRSGRPLSEPTGEDNALQLQAWRRPAGLPHSQTAAVVRHGYVALPGEPPATGRTTLDFSRSFASPQASAKLFKALQDVKVPWPDPLPTPLPTGVLKGLYWINGKWHASVGGLLFQVNVVPGFGDVYLVHPQHPLHPGFRLVSDSQGHWRLDRQARLEGGMRKGRMGEWQRKHKERLDVLNAELQALNAEAISLMFSFLPFETALNTARTTLIEQKVKLREDWIRLGTSKPHPVLHASVAARHEQRRIATAQAKVQWDIAFDNYKKNAQATLSIMPRVEAKSDELIAADRTDPKHKTGRDLATQTIYLHWASVNDTVVQKFSDTLETERGESTEELGDRVNRELPQHITDAYETFIHTRTQQIETLKQMIESMGKLESILQQADPALRQRLLEGRPAGQNLSTVAIKQNALILLLDLVLDRSHGSRIPAEFPFVKELIDEETTISVLTHAEIRTTAGYTAREQMDVLNDILERYERLENAVNSLTEMGSGFIREAYRVPFKEHLDEARTSLEAQLTNLILVEEGFAPQPVPDKPTRQKPANRRVIKTVDEKSLIGDLRPSQADAPGNYADIKDTLTGAVVATYQENTSSGRWQVVKPASVARPLNAIKAQAQTIRAERAGIDANIRFQQRKLLDPRRLEGLNPYDWDVMLSQHAEKFKTLADELVLNHADDKEFTALYDDYLKEANAAIEQARKVCSEGYLLQRPKISKVEYLWRHGFIDIKLVKSRKQLAATDYLTEYVIHDKSKTGPGAANPDDGLWYAHFHYNTVDAPASPAAFAHLKTKAERGLTGKDRFDQVADKRAVINLEKAQIKPPLDKLFLDQDHAKPE
ncbi:dermonecrotic toxin domain-containing protein [Pseudomonas sp. AM4(2022)]|uniref:dermonecrotic toxin domain-containing protein n=1 Tax=Pseudomonas sp. AM4(2022) TaxID=2983408 RepID=UPI002E81D6F7|nr:DUF6543 domain-containing protein [Pseudomonas sp. AM4(2022)]